MNVTVPVPESYVTDVHIDTWLPWVLDLFRYTTRSPATSAEIPEPLNMSVCAGSAEPSNIFADSMDVCVMRIGVGNAALRLLVMDAKVSTIVPVAAAVVAGVKVSVACVVSEAVVPEPGVTVPDDAEAVHETPAVMAVSVVAVMLVAFPTVSRGCEKLTVVGNL